MARQSKCNNNIVTNTLIFYKTTLSYSQLRRHFHINSKRDRPNVRLTIAHRLELLSAVMRGKRLVFLHFLLISMQGITAVEDWKVSFRLNRLTSTVGSRKVNEELKLR